MDIAGYILHGISFDQRLHKATLYYIIMVTKKPYYQHAYCVLSTVFIGHGDKRGYNIL